MTATTTTTTTTNNDNEDIVQLLGGEAPVLHADVEHQGVMIMMQALTAEERNALSDLSMPMRHLRAEKVSSVASSLCLK